MCRTKDCKNEPAQRGYWETCFADYWWKSDLTALGGGLSCPTTDLRNVTKANWTLTMVAAVTNANFMAESAAYTLNKLTRGALRSLPGVSGYVDRSPTKTVSTGCGHSYLIIKSGGLSLSFGYASNGVESPDHDEGVTTGKQLAIDYQISNDDKNRMCDVISSWLVDARYDIMSTNCTLFVKECGDAAGIWYLGNRIPTYSSTSGINLTHTPDNLYTSLSCSSYAYDPRTQQPLNVAPNSVFASTLQWLSSNMGGLMVEAEQREKMKLVMPK